MRTGLFAAAALAFALLIAAPATAETLRFPASGGPAFVAALPDGWGHEATGDSTMLLLPADHSGRVSVKLEIVPKADSKRHHSKSSQESVYKPKGW